MKTAISTRSEHPALTIAWRIAAIVIVLAVTFGAAFAQDAKPRVAFLLKTIQEARHETGRALFTKAVTDLGAGAVFSSANNVEKLPLTLVKAILDGGLDVIVLQPVAEVVTDFEMRNNGAVDVPSSVTTVVAFARDTMDAP